MLSFLINMHLNAQNNPVQIFENFIDGYWLSEGKQMGGHDGKTEKYFEWGLNGKMVKVKTHNTNPETLEFGLRNEGVRFWSAEDSLVHFYEFDVFGGITKGIVTIENQNIHYDYEYQGYKLRDSWIFIDENTYKYIVGVWEAEAWKQKFYEGEFIRKE